MTKQKTCPVCNKEFTPSFSSLQKTCSVICAHKFNSEKEIKKRVAQMKRDLKTHKDYIQVLQRVFNAYIRLRDKDCLCVSCGCQIKGPGHASHFFSVGAYPNLRFNEDNVHRSCERCNTHLHGNLSNYAYMLPKKIGYERFEQLHADSLVSNKLTIPEIQELIITYKNKTK
jgi:5-methylcytosine-specific restriction endonuclease McrA